MNEKEIADYVIEFVKQRVSVLGCQLGAELHLRFPETNFRTAYGGLRRFVDSHCQGQVVRTGTHGGDDIYCHISNTTGSGTLTRAAYAESVTEWEVFQKPGSPMQLLVDPASGATKIVAEKEEVSNELLVVSKVKDEEHISIAREFLTHIDAAEVALFKAALEEPNYWPAWSRLMSNPPGFKYRSRWTAFRFDRICELLLARLKGLGIAEATAASILERVKAVKKLKRTETEASRKTSTAAAFSSVSDEGELRRLAKLAIDLMGNDDLRRVWLPLGVIADALRKR
jgi:hypothetical protein